MANEDRTTEFDLEAEADAGSCPFNFFQAVRRLERAATDKPRVGEALSIKEDIVRFGQEPTLASENGPIAKFEPPDGSNPAHMLVHFLGLLGPNGPMPLHLTEFTIGWENDKCQRLRRLSQKTGHEKTAGGSLDTAKERKQEKSRIARFFDIFHHRMIALFYRAWATHQQTVSFERVDDPFGRYIGSLIGYGTPEIEETDEVPQVAKLHFAGHLVSQTRYPDGLEAILKAYFGVEAKVIEFVGEWIEIKEHRRCRLGLSNCNLNKNTLLGDWRWECQQKFRLRLGPMNLQKYEQMLPGGKALKRLVGWVRTYVGDALRWDVQLVLTAEAVPVTPSGFRLGYTTWLCGRKVSGHRDDLVFDPLAAAEKNRSEHA